MGKGPSRCRVEESHVAAELGQELWEQDGAGAVVAVGHDLEPSFPDEIHIKGLEQFDQMTMRRVGLGQGSPVPVCPDEREFALVIEDRKSPRLNSRNT